MQNSFYGPINPPTNQTYPNSDAGYYDSMAQSLLIGYPYLGDIPTRPLYIVFLAFLHWLAGDRYNLIIAGQTLLLAFIPVLLVFPREEIAQSEAQEWLLPCLPFSGNGLLSHLISDPGFEFEDPACRLAHTTSIITGMFVCIALDGA